MFGQEGREAANDSRNAAREYASRNQSGNQWFGHNSSAPPPVAGAKQHSRGVGEFSNKNKGESEDWYTYDAASSPSKSPGPRKPRPVPQSSPSEPIDSSATRGETKQRAKAGKQMSQDWYTHEGYGDVMTPLEKKRMAEKIEKRKKITSSNPDAAGRTSPTKNTRNGNAGNPDWYTHEGHGDGEVSPTHHHKRGNPGMGDYVKKAKEGSAKQWYGHDGENNAPGEDGQGNQSPRVKPEGQAYADRNKGSVQDWLFNYENMSLNEADTPRSSKKISAKKYVDSVDAVMHMENKE